MSVTAATTGKILQEQAVNDFKATLRGKLVRPGDPDYDEERKIFNAMIDKRPELMVGCAGVADVISAVNFAQSNNLLVAVRAAGHNVAGICVCDGGMLIDLSRMKGIRLDPATQTIRVEAGLTWGEVNHELQVFGLAATGGFVSTTGVAGLTLGGGLGWLVRKHGLALDNLLSADVVTADGRFLTASSTQNQDLFWAIRGGGGNFGIVTSFEFKVHRAGTVLGGLVFHPLSKGKQALQFWRDFEATAPEELTAGALIFNCPPDLPLPDSLRKEPMLAMGGVFTGNLDKGEKALLPLRQFGPPEADVIQRMPYQAAQSMADFLFPRRVYNYWKSSYLKSLSDDAIDTIVQYSATFPSALTVVVIEHNGGGAMDRISADATAFGHRNWPFNFLVTSIWKDPADSDTNIRWTREFFDAMKPFLADGAYVNYLGETGEEGVRAAYGAKYERLATLKKKYDPGNLFRVNQNIKPAA
jgi:FAD/FMN-containing dehydrogenase